MRLLIRWIVNAVALLVVAKLVPGIEASSLVTLFVAALVLGLLNAVVRPVLLVLTFPLTVVTLGLFIFVLNAIVPWLAGALVPGFNVDGFLPALVGAFVFSVISMLTSWIGKEKED
jgi:putative membrane protein